MLVVALGLKSVDAQLSWAIKGAYLVPIELNPSRAEQRAFCWTIVLLLGLAAEVMMMMTTMMMLMMVVVVVVTTAIAMMMLLGLAAVAFVCSFVCVTPYPTMGNRPATVPPPRALRDRRRVTYTCYRLPL